MAELKITQAGPTGMITLRGDLSDQGLQELCTGLTGTGFPDRLGAETGDDTGLFWMSPDELLLLLPQDRVAEALRRIAEALEGQHHLAADVSGARALFTVEGAWVRELLAKLTPADLHPASLATGQIRRSHLGQVAAAFWLPREGVARIICFRSVADYMRELLEVSSRAGPVGHF